MKRYKITRHAKNRMLERTSLNHRERKMLFANAIQHGKNPQDIKDEKIRNYLYSKQRNAYIKLYKGYVFIYSKNTKHLYTMYALPSHLNKETE